MHSGTFLTNPVWLALWFLLAICTGGIAQYRRRKFWSGFFLGVLFGPLSLIFVLLEGKRHDQ